MNCKKCNREAKMFWTNKSKTNGHSETFHRDMCPECYEKEYGKKPLTLHQINEQRKKEFYENKIRKA